ncbi:hypothetical protein PGT21_032922 [Puccinia graminis f. sp. tritici]|uniref:Uncharacterized protein n=1 Tax=Puccinia graminis f. sp. tritici TaxID=56615 RepID=A0A5B0MZJ2_PUCGR|nr:hypothetical protein PGT21_032922 [Puccinia graminis f. sp. tritici]
MSLNGDEEGDRSLWLEGMASVGAQQGGQGKLYALVTMLRLRQDCRVVKEAVLNLPHGSTPAASLFELPSYFPRCHPLSPPQTPHVTPPTPVGPSTPPAAPKQVSHRRFRLWSAPNPASAPWCSPLFVASPQYTLNPRSAAGRDPRRPPMPEFPATFH